MGRSQPKDSKKAKKWGGNFATNNNKWKENPSKTQLKGSEQERPLDFSAIFESVQK